MAITSYVVFFLEKMVKFVERLILAYFSEFFFTFKTHL